MTSQNKEYKWAVIKSTARDPETKLYIDFVNVVPTFGTKHKLAPDCWCEPKTAEEGKVLILSSDN